MVKQKAERRAYNSYCYDFFLNKKSQFKRLSLLLALGIFFYFSFVVAEEENNWIIDGNKVYVDDNNAYISAEPYQISKDDYVFFNVTSKIYSGNVDVILGFNTTEVNPISTELYSPEWKNKTLSYACYFNNSYFNYTISPKHFWCYLNRTGTGNGTGLELIYDRDFEWGNLAEKTAYWNESYLQEWKDISGVWQTINQNYGGMNKWFYKQNISIQANKSYQFRVYIEINKELRTAEGWNGFLPEPIDTKYWFAIKPSSETLQEAISNEHLYALDPWINSTGTNQNKDYLTTGLTAYYNFDDATGNLIDKLLGAWNVSQQGTVPAFTGIINNSRGTYTSANFFERDVADSSPLNFDTGDFTVSVWINASGNSQTFAQIIGNQFPANNNKAGMALHIYSPVSQVCVFMYNSSNSEKYMTYTPASLNGWNNLVARRTGTNVTMWWNGVLVNSMTCNFNVTATTMNTTIGSAHNIAGADSKPFRGYIDEVGIWNRTLNSTEISDLYNNGNGITYSPAPPDITPPNVIIDSPLNQTYSTRSIDFNLTVLDESTISTCLYSLDGGANITMYNNTASHFYHTNLSVTKGSHTAYFYCNDTSGNINNTESVTFYISSCFYPENLTHWIIVDNCVLNDSYNVVGNITISANVTLFGNITFINSSQFIFQRSGTRFIRKSGSNLIG